MHFKVFFYNFEPRTNTYITMSKKSIIIIVVAIVVALAVSLFDIGIHLNILKRNTTNTNTGKTYSTTDFTSMCEHDSVLFSNVLLSNSACISNMNLQTFIANSMQVEENTTENQKYTVRYKFENLDTDDENELVVLYLDKNNNTNILAFDHNNGITNFTTPPTNILIDETQIASEITVTKTLTVEHDRPFSYLIIGVLFGIILGCGVYHYKRLSEAAQKAECTQSDLLIAKCLTVVPVLFYIILTLSNSINLLYVVAVALIDVYALKWEKKTLGDLQATCNSSFYTYRIITWTASILYIILAALRIFHPLLIK